MLKHTSLYIIITCILFTQNANAQEYAPAQLNYQHQELFINPAYTGSHGVFSGAVSVQMQMVGFDKAPNTQRLQLHSPLVNNTMGLGLSFQHEMYGVTRNFALSAHYAYKIKMDKGILSLGLQMGFTTMQERYAELETPIPDPLFAENTQPLWGFSSGVGAYYYDSLFYIGLSIPQLIDNSLITAERKLANKLNFEKTPIYLTGGYVFTLSRDFKLKPAALFSYSSYRGFGYNVNLTSYYKNKCWLGAIARYNKQAGGFVGVNIENYVNIGYMFTVNYGSAFSKVSQSAIHEISIAVMLSPKNETNKFKCF